MTNAITPLRVILVVFAIIRHHKSFGSFIMTNANEAASISKTSDNSNVTGPVSVFVF